MNKWDWSLLIKILCFVFIIISPIQYLKVIESLCVCPFRLFNISFVILFLVVIYRIALYTVFRGYLIFVWKIIRLKPVLLAPRSRRPRLTELVLILLSFVCLIFQYGRETVLIIGYLSVLKPYWERIYDTCFISRWNLLFKQLRT